MSSVIRQAAYVLYNVKRFVDGCGGLSQFLFVGRDGSWHRPFEDDSGFELLRELEDAFYRLDMSLKVIVPAFVNYGPYNFKDVASRSFRQQLQGITDSIVDLRERHVGNIAEREEAYMNRQMEENTEDEEMEEG